MHTLFITTVLFSPPAHTRTHAQTHAHTHTRTPHTNTHTHTHTHTLSSQPSSPQGYIYIYNNYANTLPFMTETDTTIQLNYLLISEEQVFRV